MTQGGRRKNKEGRTCTYVDRRRVLTSLNILKGYVIKLNIRKGLYYIKIEYSCQYAVSRGVGYIHKDCLTILYILVYIYR